MDSAADILEWPSGSSQMDQRIRAFDWGQTELGARREWPPYLRATVDMMLAHGFPMILLWGPRLVQIYNDGYADIMQDKHPGGLGQATSECWPEVWHINGPIYDRVKMGETITYQDKLYPLARPGGLEDTWFTITYSPVRNSGGAVEGVLVTMFDTSAAQRARLAQEASEAELRESEQRLALAFKLLPVGVAIVDGAGDVVTTNDVMRRYLPTDRIPSRDDANAGRWRGWHPDGRPIERRDFATARALRGETVVPGTEFLFTGEDGREQWTRVASAPILDPEGEVSGALSIVLDIDDLKRSAERIRVNEERFRQFASASSNVLWIRSADTLAMEFVNPAFEPTYGMTWNDGVSDVRWWAACVIPDDRQAVLAQLQRVRAGESVVHEYRIQRRSDNEFRWILSTDFPLFDADGRVNRIAGIATDVTDARRTQEHQQVLLAELQHRVRNIMAMLVSLVSRSRTTAASADEYAELVSGRLMSLARTQALLTRAANAGVDIHTILDDELGAQAHDPAQYELAGPSITLPAKVTEVLSLAVHELATNALKYGALAAPDGRVSVRWETHVENDQRWVTVHWRERRTPSPAWMPPARRGFGTMLIEQRVPYELGGRGRINVDAGGAEAHIEFPLRDTGSVLDTHAPTAARVAGGSNDIHADVDLSGHHVLVLDDDFYLAQDTASALRTCGAQVMGPFSQSSDAVQAVHGGLTGAILDINLGNGACFATAARLSECEVPFVFLTGYDVGVIPDIFQDVPVLQKPATPRQIVLRLAQRLSGRCA